MEKFRIRAWVNKITEQRPFRQAVHTVLAAISGDEILQSSMTMKGGILLALGYDSTRFTKDIDFSTATKTKDFDGDHFKAQFERALLVAVEQLDYGLDCRVQSWRQEPPGKDKNFPTIQMRIGYANKGDTKAHKRLRANKSPHVVEVDYSLNEPTGDAKLFEIEEGKSIRTYSFHDLVGEKFRALLQQETRRRIRPQDIFDLGFLLKDHTPKDDPSMKSKILNSLKKKAAARSLAVDRESMRNPEIVRRTRADYHHLQSQIEGDLPQFEDVYAAVSEYYENLPWKA